MKNENANQDEGYLQVSYSDQDRLKKMDKL